jgi:hypothetical protein
MSLAKLRKQLKVDQTTIARLTKENELKSKCIGRCMHRARIVDDVYDQVESLERQVANVTMAKQIVEQKYSELEKSLNEFNESQSL